VADRIAVPLGGQEAATNAAVLLAAGIARWGGYTVELVAGGDDGDRSRRWEAAARAAGAPAVTVIHLEGDDDELAAYAVWSGASLWCAGRARRAHVPAVPMLLAGPRCALRPLAPRRVVVGVGSDPRAGRVATVAAALAERAGAELVLVEVFDPVPTVAEVPECAHLRRVARALVPPAREFETLHDRHPAAGIARFVDEATVLAVGAPAGRGRRVVPSVVRRACCPVVVVPR
jgi:hypothetical protein